VRRLILFDIDGTLLRCGPQIRDLLGGALEEVFGTALPASTGSFAGKTDPRIVLDLLRAAGIPRQRVEASFGSLQASYLRRLETGLDRSRMRLLPGVREVLDGLSRRSDVVLGLLTGNWERGARIKLDRFGLNPYFPFGAFGDEVLDRDELPPIALERARQRTGRSFAAHEVLIVGDTVLDVQCARTHGIPVLAVATGGTDATRLARAGADWVVSSLAEAEAVALGAWAAPPSRC
jgi:phosphoglycolate phosphatase-like HAD superfamily hydrolase